MLIHIYTSDLSSIKPLLKDFYIPPPFSHKGQNGKILIIGGSSLFHAPVLWVAEIASHFVDMVHFTSTEENNEIFVALKKKFQNGMVVKMSDLENYINEDDAIAVGSGMMRTQERLKPEIDYTIRNLNELAQIEHEGIKTYYFVKHIIAKAKHKKIVFDAGALQMMDPAWLLKLDQKPIVTPHQKEFERLFGIPVDKLSEEKKITIVTQTARDYHCIILLKAVIDIISDGTTTYVVRGGNQGLTKGGSGDILAGLSCALYAKNEALFSAVLASYFLKRTADELYKSKGFWYNSADLIDKIPQIVKEIAL
ncbi:NAD(P)H-hydrate dehydratase [Candidatus Roizmanbacteria bacterium]|nr:NAD(P)H-hydrate dehydratase [Candidatus Roizmanbacteria bacterium]